MGTYTPWYRRGATTKWLGLRTDNDSNDPDDATTQPDATSCNLDAQTGAPGAITGTNGSMVIRTDGTENAGTWLYVKLGGAVRSFAQVVQSVVTAVSMTVTDNLFRIRDEADATKLMAFQVSSVTAGQTRTLTMADADVDLRSTPEDAGLPAAGTIRVFNNPADAGLLTVTVGSVGPVVFEFDNDAAVVPGNISVQIGGAQADTALNLRNALAAQFPNSTWTVHGTDTTVINCRHAATLGTAEGFTFVDGTGGDVVVQDRAQERVRQRVATFVHQLAVTAEDVTIGHFQVQTGLSTILSHTFRIRTSATDNTEVLYDGTVSVSGGVVEFDDNGVVKLAAGNLVAVWGIGVR